MRHIAGALLLLLGVAGRVEAKDLASPPHFYYLANQHENSALSMDCEGDPPYLSIRCHFTQVVVSRQKQAPPSQKDIAEFLAEPWEKVRKLRDDMCTTVGRGPAADSLPPAPGSAKAAARTHYLSVVKPMCACSDAPCVWRVMQSIVNEQTCTVWANTFDLSFSRAPGERKWISDSKPEGLCNVVTIAVIELDPKDTSEVLWTYTQTRLTADKTSSLCQHLEIGVPLVNSWRAAGSSLLDCKFVTFGLP